MTARKPAHLKMGRPNRAKPKPTTTITVAPITGQQAEPPTHLDAAGRAMWEGVIAVATWVSPSDWPTLTRMCELQDRRAQFVRELHEQGSTFTTATGYVALNPLAAAIGAIEAQQAKLCTAMLLDPAARERVGYAASRPALVGKLENARSRLVDGKAAMSLDEFMAGDPETAAAAQQALEEYHAANDKARAASRPRLH